MSDELPAQVELLCTKVRKLNSQPPSNPTLVYFDIIGIAWPIRCLLHLKDVDYELIRIPIQHWTYQDAEGNQPLKAAFRNGHVPLYVDKEVNLNQSNIILMHLGEKYDLLGDCYEEKLAAMEVSAHAYDSLFHFSGLLQINIKRGIPDETIDARLSAYMGDGVWGTVSKGFRNNLDAFQRYLDANTTESGFMVGTRLSVADLHAFNILCNWFKAFDREKFVEGYPGLDDYIHRIGNIPLVKDYILNLQEPTIWFPLPEIALRLTSAEELEGLINMNN